MTPTSDSKAAAIIGVGNSAAGDDAAGLLVLDALHGMGVPDHVALVDAGLAGPGLVSYMMGYARVVLVDAVDMGLAPGEVRTFRPEDVRSTKPGTRLSLHSCDLLEVLALAHGLGLCPEVVVIVGIQPKAMSPGADATPEVQRAAPEAARQALAAAGDLDATRPFC